MTEKQGSAIKRLKALGDDVLSIVDSRLTAMEPASHIAKWLQEERGVLLEIKQTSVKKMLERYRYGELRNKVMTRIKDAHTHVPIATVQKRLNALDELEDIVRIQRGRVDKMLLLEADKPILLKTTTDEIHLLKDALVDLGRMQMETGVLARAPRTFKGQVTGANGEVKQFEWTEAQEELYQEIMRVTGGEAEV